MIWVLDHLQIRLVCVLSENINLGAFSMINIDPSIDFLSIHNPLIRIRHGGELLNCQLEKVDKTWRVTLESAIQGISEGQFGVIYFKNEHLHVCLGGGMISRS